MKNKCFPHYWTFVSRIQRSRVVSAHKGLVMRRFDVVIVSLNKLLNERSRCRWFQTPWRSWGVILSGECLRSGPYRPMWRRRRSHTCLPKRSHNYSRWEITMSARLLTLTSWWPRWHLKSPASRLFTQPFIQTQIKENIKAPCHWPLCGEFTGTGEFPAQRASYAENVSIWWRHHVLQFFRSSNEWLDFKIWHVI